MTTPTPGDALTAAVHIYGRSQFQIGVDVGLIVAEKILVWLNRQPDTARQRETREWAEEAIAECRRENGLEVPE